jgi:spermidine synthase
LIDRTHTPDGSVLELHRRGTEFAIRAGGRELMSSRTHGSETRFAELGVAAMGKQERAHVLVAGLGCGYTLAATLAALDRAAEVIVSEISAAVIRWNRELLGGLAGHPLSDRRVELRETDVIDELAREGAPFHLILLDVDNGPEALTQAQNGWLYQDAGLARLRAKLHPGGVLGIWSAGPESAFAKRLRGHRFGVIEHRAHAHSVAGGKGGAGKRHTIWLATRVD